MLVSAIWSDTPLCSGHLDLLSTKFGYHVITRRSAHPWPARFPDLSVWDFFFWGALKEKVYASSPSTLEELKASITQETLAIEQRVSQFEERLTRCLDADGAHIE